MNKKGFYKALSVILIMAMILPMLPTRVIKAEEETVFNPDGEILVASPSAITAMAAVDSTILDISDGPITVTNQSYVQKTSGGTVIREGNITGELVVTGSTSNAAITLNGTNIPTIRLINYLSSASIGGTATGTLNIILEGNISVMGSSLLNAFMENFTTVNIAGAEGNYIYGSGYITCGGQAFKIENLNVSGLNFYANAGEYIGIGANKNLTVTNCTQTGDGYIVVRNANTTTLANPSSYNLNIKDCVFNAAAFFSNSHSTIENVQVLNTTNDSNFLAAYASCDITIKDSYLQLKWINWSARNVTINNSYINCAFPGYDSYFYNPNIYGNLYINGSTLINNRPGKVNFYINKDNTTFINDSSILFSGPFGSYYGFATTADKQIVLHDTYGNLVYLNRVKVPGASNAMVKVSIDGRPQVNLGTDSEGYLFLYLATGQHTVTVIGIDGIRYSTNFTASTGMPSGTSPNIVGDLVPSDEPTVITTPYLNTAIQYSFDYKNWYLTTTDGTGTFEVVIPSNAIRIYIRLNSGETKHAVISDGVIGDFYDENPIITEQSNTNLTFTKGMPGTIYVTAISYIIGNTLTYKWYKNGEILQGKTLPVLHISAAKDTDAGTYACMITEPTDKVITSNPITVTVDDSQPEEEKELKIISQSSAKTLIKGYSTELYVNAKPSLSTRELTYQWYKDEEALPGATDTKLVLSNVKLEDSGSYLCRVYENEDYIDSVPIPLTVINNPLEEDVTDLNALVDALTSQIETLTGHLNSANQDKEALQNTINTLEGQIITYTNQITGLQERIEELELELEAVQGENTTLKQTILNLNNQIDSLNQQIIDLQADLETANNEKAALEIIVTDLYNDISNLNLQITVIEGKLADSEAQNTELANQITELHNTITELETEITNFQNDIDSLTEQNNQLLTQVESLVGQKTALENEIQRLLGLLDDAYETIDDLTKQVNDLTEEVNTLTEQLNAANGEKTDLQATITDLEEQITSLTNQIDALNNRVSELEEALQQEGADKEALNQTIIDLNIQITTVNQIVISLQTQLTTVTEERDTLQNTVNRLNNQVTELNQQITILIGNLEDSEEENTTLRNQVIILQNSITGLESDITNLQNEITIINNNYNTLQSQLYTANETISSLNALLFLIRGELGVIGNDEIIPAIQLLKAQLQQEKNKNILLQDQLDGLNNELDTAREYNSVLIQKLQELMLLIGSEDTEGIKNKIIELQTALSDSKTRIQELEQEKIILIECLREAEELNQTLRQRIEELLDLADADVEELKRKILELTEQVNQMIQNNQELQESIQTLNSQVILLNSEKSVLESEIVRLETLLNTANSTIEELRQQLADMAAGKTILENENTAFRNEIADLKQQLTDMTNVKTDLEAENAALKIEIERLKKLLESKNHSGGGNSGGSDNSSAVKDLQDKLDQTQEELEETKKELEKLKESEGTAGDTDKTNSGNSNTEIKVPEKAVVVLPAETVDKPVIKAPEKTVKEETIIAEKGWEIAPTLESEWAKEIDLVEAVGQTNKEEKVDYTFYAREEEKPEQVYTQTVEVKKPAAIPNFTMDKLIYLGSEFNLNVANIPKDAKITYKSADNSIAKIDKNGKITPVKAGKTVITGAVTKDGIPYQFTVNVTVKETGIRTLNLKDQAVQTSTDNPVLLVYKLVNKDKTTKINLNGYSNSASISYISADSSIATVSKDGVIKGIKKGTTTVTATLAQNDTIYTYIIKVRVDDGTADKNMWNYLTPA